MKTSLRKAAVPQRHVAPRRNDRRLTGQHPRRRFLHLAAGAAALPAVSRIAMAQTYPARPITMVVPYAPGGATDVIARNLVERMKASLGQPVIIENVAGAGGTIGTGRVARARPDGYTLGIGHVGTHATNGATFASERLRAGGPAFNRSASVPCKEGPAGRRLEGPHRLVEVQS
jgi:Tripartite tricarboxylate transporter family receptor